MADPTRPDPTPASAREDFKDNLSKEAALGLLKEFYEDPIFYCKIILPHWFPKEIPWVHRGFMAILYLRTGFLAKYGELDKIHEHFVWRPEPDNPDGPIVHMFEWNEDKTGLTLNITPFTLVMMPRGFSKTSHINAWVLWNAGFKEFRFPVYLGETQTHAETQLNNVRLEIEGNGRFRAIFGDLKPEQRKGYKWTQDILQLANGVIIGARGRGSQVRGMLVDGQRPNRLLGDDIEDRESVKTAEQREKTALWFFGDALPALPEMDPQAGAVMTGTLLHSEALLAKLRTLPDWNTIIFGASLRMGQENDEPLWGLRMSLAKIELKKLSYGRIGQLSTFYLEYYNTVRGDEGRKFHSHYIIIRPSPQDYIHRSLACDPAISDKADADFFALACVGRSDNGRIGILDVWGERGVLPRRQVDLFFEWRKRWGMPRFNGVESVAYQAALLINIREEMFRRKDYFEVTPILHGRTRKTERVEGILAPRYAAGYIDQMRHFPMYESQLLDWPNGKKDLPDVVSMAIALLDPTASMVLDPEKDGAADEYPELDDELGEWRAAP